MFEAVARHWTVWRESWRAENARPKTQRVAAEREFLPASIEILETPASPAGRAVMLTIAAFFVLALVWAVWGQIDVVAVAQGKIIPHTRSKVVQPSEMGVVRAIHVRDGDRVAAGDLLISLDPTDSEADLERIQTELLAARLDVARLEALSAEFADGAGDDPATKPENRKGAGDPAAAFAPPPEAPTAMIRTHRRLIAGTVSELQARLAVQDHELGRYNAEYRVVQTTLAKLEAQIPLIREQTDIRHYLADKGLSSKLLLLDLQERLTEAEHEAATQRERMREVKAAVAGVHRQIEQIRQEYRRDRLAELLEAATRVAALEQELRKAEKRSALQGLTAPVDGVVQQLAVHTVGGVVQPAEALMVVVPNGETLEVEAKVLNKDIGFVAVGQEAEVKLETFPYTKYGVIRGDVVDVSTDAIQDEDLGLVYNARVALAETAMRVGDKIVALTPGMATTVEIKTGTRHAIEFLLSPLLRYRQESWRER